MNCPSCSSVLKPIHYEGTELHTCDGCGGEFVSPQALAHVVNTRDATPVPRSRKGTETPQPVAGVPKDVAIRKMNCPACGSGTTVINYALDTGVCVDRCGVCGGVWLDKDELEHIQAILEQAEDAAPMKIAGAAHELAKAREKNQQQTTGAFEGSRFSFVNAVINRLLDAA